MERFYDHVQPGIPVIVAGDFNDSEESPVVQWIERRGLVNSLPEFDRSTETWRWKYRGVMLKRRMDHIFYSKDIYCADAKVMKAGASDHYPVIARFRKQIH
jgi:endonuclease/exonuclease/phosphatase (EEP) superfamily protein YafD